MVNQFIRAVIYAFRNRSFLLLEDLSDVECWAHFIECSFLVSFCYMSLLPFEIVYFFVELTYSMWSTPGLKHAVLAPLFFVCVVYAIGHSI